MQTLVPFQTSDLVRTSLGFLETWRSAVGVELGDSSVDTALVHFLGDAASAGGRGVALELAEQMHWSARWAQDGFPTFELTHGLASALLLTECRGLTAEDLRMPFSAVRVILPHPDGPVRFTDVVGAPVDATWIAFSVGRIPEPNAGAARADAILRGLSAARGARGFSRKEVRAVRDEALAACDAWRTKTITRVSAADGVGIFRRDVLRPGDALERWLCVRNAAPDQQLVDGVSAAGRDVVHDVKEGWRDADEAAIKATQRLLANLCVYLCSRPKEELAAAENRRAAPRRPAPGVDVAPGPRVWVLGREIKLPKDMRDAARAFAELGRPEVRWRTHARFVVRGHWRRQAVGKGRAERKTIWIHPFWKGPENAAVALARLYEVEARPEPAP